MKTKEPVQNVENEFTQEDNRFVMNNSAPQQTNIVEMSELGDVMKYFNEDVIEPDKSMSSIDTKTRLGHIEISGIMCVDYLVGTSFLPQRAMSLTRTKKRLNVSLRGLGRAEMVQVVIGKREQDQKANPMGLPK